MRRSTVRRLVVASGRPPGRTSATSRWTVFEPMSRTPRRTGRGYRSPVAAARGPRHPLTRYDERDVRRPRAHRLAGALALPRDRPRRVVAPGGRDGAAARPRPRSCRSGDSATASTWPRSPRCTCRCRGCCRCTPRPTKRLGADTSAFLGEADSTTPFVVGRRRLGRRRQVHDRAPAARAHEPLAGHAAGRARHDRRLPLPERRARAARAHEPQGLPRVVRPARAASRSSPRSRAAPPRCARRSTRTCATTSCPTRTSTVRRPDVVIVEGLNVLQPPPHPERRRGERPVRLLDLRRRRQRRTSRSGSSTGSSRCGAARSATRTRSSTSSRTSPTKRPSSARSGSGTTSTCRTSRRTCCRRKHRATPRAARRPPTTRSSGCCCASSDAASLRDPVADLGIRFVQAPRITRRLPLEACVESSDTWARGRARPSSWPDSRGSSTAATTPPASP